MDRRDFVRIVAAGAAGAAFLDAGPVHAFRPRPRRSSDTVGLAIIGAGSRGKAVLQEMLRVPAVRAVALCDVFEPRLAEARRVTGEETPGYTDYRRMLDERRGEIDAVIVASPIAHHEEHVVAALERGIHVYGEKSLAYDVRGCERIARAVERSGRVFQVGHQYRYAPWAIEAVRRIHAGEIGEVTHIFGYWHRNHNWRRPMPPVGTAGRSARELERLINWRLYTETSRGLIAELGSHHIDFANWILKARPEAVVGSGGIAAYRDGRTTYDHVHVTYDYPDERKLVFSSLLNNARVGYQLQVMGTAGSVDLTLEGATICYEPRRANSAVPEGMGAPAVATGPSLAARGDMPYEGKGETIEAPGGNFSASLLCSGNFIENVRSGDRPWTDVRVGWSSAVPVVFGDEATRKGSRIDFRRVLARVPAPEIRAVDAAEG